MPPIIPTTLLVFTRTLRLQGSDISSYVTRQPYDTLLSLPTIYYIPRSYLETNRALDIEEPLYKYPYLLYSKGILAQMLNLSSYFALYYISDRKSDLNLGIRSKLVDLLSSIRLAIDLLTKVASTISNATRLSSITLYLYTTLPSNISSNSQTTTLLELFYKST